MYMVKKEMNGMNVLIMKMRKNKMNKTCKKCKCNYKDLNIIQMVFKSSRHLICSFCKG